MLAGFLQNGNLAEVIHGLTEDHLVPLSLLLFQALSAPAAPFHLLPGHPCRFFLKERITDFRI